MQQCHGSKMVVVDVIYSGREVIHHLGQTLISPSFACIGISFEVNMQHVAWTLL